MVEVTFLSSTDDNLLRQMSYQGRREDKAAVQVTRCAICAKLKAESWAGKSVASDSYFDLLAKATHARRLMEHLRSPADLAAMTDYARELEAKAEALLRREVSLISGAAWSDVQTLPQAQQDRSEKE